ncbi:MAG: hypothetical protein J0J01_05175 [Reyranella sp.]|uniref:hypothetical protein n=1 Tax=Reyranella sp. TaxID=1929291 RepID=UPI001AD09CC0|nr:hypothetical protein [Reyranella sp.]MBN9086277.1 hypothetical protein [Reyranella sp.]
MMRTTASTVTSPNSGAYISDRVLSERQALILRAAELEHDNDDKIAGLAEANASAASELARIDGQPETPSIDGARSAVWRTAIDQRIAGGKGPQAIVLFDRVKDRLVPADRLSLDTPVQAARYEHAADQWIAGQAGTDGPPLQRRVDSDANLPSEAKAIVRAKVDAQESASESTRAARVQALDDEARAAMYDQAVNPRAYKPGTFARLADAYDAAGASESAAFARRLATYDAFIASFAQASAEKQQRMIDELPEEWRHIAAIIQDRQAAVFAQDAFAAGTAIYKEVGSPVPIDDIQGRIRQARQIAQLRGGNPVLPFTVREIRQMQRVLGSGSDQDKEAVRTRLAAVPVDMRPPIEPGNGAASTDQEAASSGGSAQAFSVQAASGIDANETAEAANTDATPSAGGYAGAPTIGPIPGSPEYQAAEAQARELEKPSYDDLSGWERFKVATKRFFLEGDSRGATYRADSAAQRWQRVQELLNEGDNIGVVGKRFLIENRNVAAEFAAAAGQLADAQRKLNELPSSDALRQLFEVGSVAEFAKLLDEKGGKIASAAAIGSVPDLTTGIVATAVLGGVGGGIVLTGSAGLEGYGRGLVGALAQRGIDVTNPNAVAAALQHKELMDDVRKDARTDGAIEAGAAALAAFAGGIGRGGKPTKELTDAELRGGGAASVRKGMAWERELAARLVKQSSKYDFAQQVMIKAPNGPVVRIDFIVRNKETKEIFLIDGKDMQRLRLKEPNQRIAYPEIERMGAVITKEGWPRLASEGNFHEGMKIPPTRIQIQTPNGPYHVHPEAVGNRIPLVRWTEPAGRLDDISG